MATEVIHQVGTGQTYTTLASWEAAQQRDLVTANQIAVAEITGDVGASYPALDIAGWVLSVANYITIRPSSGNTFNLLTKTGAKLVSSGADAYGVLCRDNHKVKIENLGVSFSSSINGLAYTYANNLTKFDNCGFFGSSALGSQNTFNRSNAVFNNCLLEADISAGNNKLYTFYGATYNNCTCIIPANSTTYSGDIAFWGSAVNNTVVYSDNTKTNYELFYSDIQGDYNARNDNGSTTIIGANSITGVLKSDFVDYANGDYRLSPASQLIGKGADLSASFTTDFEGDARGTIWDIGFDQYVASGGGSTITDSATTSSTSSAIIAALVVTSILTASANVNSVSASVIQAVTGVNGSAVSSINSSASTLFERTIDSSAISSIAVSVLNTGYQLGAVTAVSANSVSSSLANSLVNKTLSRSASSFSVVSLSTDFSKTKTTGAVTNAVSSVATSFSIQGQLTSSASSVSVSNLTTNQSIEHSRSASSYTVSSSSTTTAIAGLVNVAAVSNTVSSAITAKGVTYDKTASVSTTSSASTGQTTASSTVTLEDLQAQITDLKATLTAFTANFVFTKANELDVNVQSMNDAIVNGTGAQGDEWRGS